MSIDLLPPRTSSYLLSHWPLPEPVMTGPRFVRTRQMSRWHRVRSGSRRQRPWDRQPSTTWHVWCGQMVYATKSISSDVPTGGVPVCGTCEGRAIGAGQEENDGPHELTFTPRWLFPPRWCPGSNKDLYEPIPDPRGWPRVGTCLACGSVESIRSHGYSVGLTKHEPAGLVDGCPFHGWQYLSRITDGDIGCYACPRPLEAAA